jgi:hypothetical protein
VLIAIAALLIWYLLKKRKEREDERIAAYREARWAPVPTTDPQEKQPPGGGPDYSYATPGYLPTDPDGPQDNGGMLSPVAEEDEARSGDEHTSLLESEHRSDHHHRESGYITEGMAPTGGAIAGLALLRSLGIGRRGSSSSHSSGEGSLAGSFRNVSGNTMEKMVGLGLVSTTSIAKQSRLSTQSGSQSHSGSGAKTTSSGSAAYLPYTDDELFYKAPFARESAHAVDSGDVYFSAESGPPTGSSGDKSSKPEEKHVPGEHGSIGSNSGSNSSSGHSRRSGRSAGSKSSSGRGPRVPTIPEHRVPSSVGFTALAGLGGAAAAGVAYGTVTSSEYDQGTESGNSQYDSAGSGSASGESNAPPRRSVDITEFGSRQPRRRERPRDRTGGFSGRSWFEKNISVGTFGEPEAERRMSSEYVQNAF